MPKGFLKKSTFQIGDERRMIHLILYKLIDFFFHKSSFKLMGFLVIEELKLKE